MKVEKIICDCCHKEVSNNDYLKLVLPVKKIGKNYSHLVAREMDVCLDCSANLHDAGCSGNGVIVI